MKDSAHRFCFIGNRLVAGSWCLLDEERIHFRHLYQNKGKKLFPLELRDGKGWAAVVEAPLDLGKAPVFPVHEETFFDRSKTKTSLILGLIKPTDLDDILAALSELSLDHLYVVAFEKSSLKGVKDQIQARWSRILEQATKQSKRHYHMSFSVHCSAEEFLPKLQERKRPHHFFYGSPSGQGFLDLAVTRRVDQGNLLENSAEQGAEFVGCIGPEGDLTALEKKYFENLGFIPVNLSPLVLRSTTAAVVMTAWLAACK